MKKASKTDGRLGKELRRLRKAKNLSVRGLGDLLGFSPSFISQLENGQVSPSIASLERIAQTLGVGLRDLFPESLPKDSGYVRTEDRPAIISEWSKALIEALTPPLETVPIDAIMVQLEPGGTSGSRLHAAPSHRFAFIWRGTVTLSTEKDQYQLKQGDAITLPQGTPHRWTNSSRRSVRIVIAAFREP